MEPEKTESRGVRRRRRKARFDWRALPWLRVGPLAIFTLLIVLGPLLFGAVDRWVQVGLVGLLALGLALAPPAMVPLSRGGRHFALVFLAILLLGQFAPAGLFGGTLWRGELGTHWLVKLPWMHHPEPTRALDALLAAGVAALWFQWVRTLAADRTQRVWMAWLLAGAGLAVALVCFVAKGAENGKIYGIRATVGWIGWGPFPNRNHTASFLAMAALITGGACAWALAKGRRKLALAGGAAFILMLGALLVGKSRGGLVALAAGFGLLLALIVWKNRDRRTVARALYALAGAAVLVVAFGGQLLARFTSKEGGAVSNDLRRLIWSDALGLWRDAPLFGHGLDTFARLFPFYTHADFDGQTVLHPESSWLLWLCEVGAIPVLLLAGALAVFVFRHLRAALAEQRHGFYLTAGALAGFVAIVVHSAIDVPAHRWGTAGFALALLAVACPVRRPLPERAPRKAALLPLAVAGFWALPFVLACAWSPLRPAQLQARQGTATLDDFSAALRHFPLDADLRQNVALRWRIERPAERAIWEEHFAIVRRLSGSVWWFSIVQARGIGREFPAQALTAWQDAVERSGRRGAEVLRGAVIESAGMKGFDVLWGQFVENHPALALAYARALIEELRVPPPEVQFYYTIWWEQCAFAGQVSEVEIADFYKLATYFGDPAGLERWIHEFSGRRRSDYREWVRLFSSWGQTERAWYFYSAAIADPVLGEPSPGSSLEDLQPQLKASPENRHLALSVAQLLAAQGDPAAADEVLLTFAQRPDAPDWFLRKGAHILAAQKHFADALAMALREKPGKP
jgi:O-antigen ligase